jgi:hypothetical protein
MICGSIEGCDPLLYRCRNVLGPVPEVDVMAKRPQGLLNVGDSLRADGGAAFLRS